MCGALCVDGAQHIAHLGDADKACAVGEELLVCVQQQVALVVDWDDLDADAFPLCQHLPRHDVGMVFHHGENHLVTLVEKSLSERERDEIDGLCGSPGEDDFVCAAGIDELPYPLPGGFMQVGGSLGEVVDAAVDVGVGIEIFLTHSIQHAKGFLRGGCIVEIDEWSVVDRSRENGELVSYGLIHNPCQLHSLQPSHLLSSPLNRLSTR